MMGTLFPLKDTRHVINVLKDIQWISDYLLVVTSLYTVISYELGLEEVQDFLSQDITIPGIQCEFILDLLQFSMIHNYFWNQGSYFLQKKGVAMGDKFAPSMANLFMTKWEEDVVLHNRRPESVIWKRFIDNIFFAWAGDEYLVISCLNYLNSNDRGFKLS